ncbi:hypothetical protein QT231_07970 [Halomonas sp. SpR1]|uniref:hypothetical protein n=1 Tax=Halomonas sp. SpR1 TaxID=3050462 RepID=UPI0027E3E1B1|nr:hypothetical protein [Halomonas sp. SpR1]MDQ7732632.1 hypothetical protein [Halomonas sp. SpR1]
MTTAISTPFSFTEFQQDLSTANKRKLLHWAGSDLCVAFLRHASGHEQPAVIQIGQQRCYAASTNAEVLHTLFTSAPLEEGTEMVVKSLSLAELARNAHLYHFGIHLSDGQTTLHIVEPSMSILGVTAIVQDLQGKEVIYQAEAFPFESVSKAATLPYGSVQYWLDIELEYDPDRDLSQIESLHVFDDQLDWSNPLFPNLPDNAKALSTLSPSAQAFFERMRVPLLPSWDGEPEMPTTPERSYQSNLIDADRLTAFNQLRAMVNQDFVPPANEITLTVIKASRLDDEPANSPERWEIKISFTTPMGIKALFAPDWIDISLCKANAELPDTIGTHRASEILRERIVNHLAWTLFQRGRSFDFGLFDDDLDGLLPGSLINSYGHFQPDYAGSSFPCLARFQCGEHQVPVLLLGQEGGNYVCKPMKFIEIPEADVSTLVPNRSELIIRESQLMVLAPNLDKLAIPTSLIDFPDYWYRGIRVSNQRLRSKFISRMRVNALLTAFEGETGNMGSTKLKWVVAGCAAALIGLVMVMNL